MQECRIYVDQRHARKRSDERDELVEIASADYGDERAQHRQRRPQCILLPLHGRGPLPRRALAEDLGLDDPGGRKQLDGCADEDGDGVEELDGVDELAGLRVIRDDFDAGLVAEGGVAEGADRGKDDGDDHHDDVEQARELAGFRHRGLDGED